MHDLARFGFAQEAAGRLAELDLEGALHDARVAHALGLADRDPGRLRAAADRFAACGARLFATEAREAAGSLT